MIRETFPPMQIQGIVYADKKEAGQALIAACKAMNFSEPVVLGAYRGFGMELSYNTFSKEFVVELKGKKKLSCSAWNRYLWKYHTY